VRKQGGIRNPGAKVELSAASESRGEWNRIPNRPWPQIRRNTPIDPAGRKHGLNNPGGPHAGDLPNVEVAANGVLLATLALPNASLTAPPGTPGALLDADGAALVIHAGADDYVTDPSGNSGARIACAVLRPVAEVR